MENARLLTEQREALEQQTATAEVLQVISQSRTDVKPVLDAVAAAACRFCGAIDASIILRDGDELVRAAHEGPLGTGGRGMRDRLDRSTVMGRSIVDGDVVHVPDVQQLVPVAYVRARELAQQIGWRAALSAPMLRGDGAIGCILLRRPDPGRFTPRQIELLETFAAQAVIAIENARLLIEQREALERQTATADVLQVINSSPGDLAPVFDAMLEKATHLCQAAFGIMNTYDGERYHAVALYGVPAAMEQIFRDPTAPQLGPNSPPHAADAWGEHHPYPGFGGCRGVCPKRSSGACTGHPWASTQLRNRCSPQGRTAARFDCSLPTGSAAVLGQTDRVAAELRGPSGDCDGERPPADRTTRSARAADGEHGGAGGHQFLPRRLATGVRCYVGTCGALERIGVRRNDSVRKQQFQKSCAAGSPTEFDRAGAVTSAARPQQSVVTSKERRGCRSY